MKVPDGMKRWKTWGNYIIYSGVMEIHLLLAGEAAQLSCIEKVNE